MQEKEYSTKVKSLKITEHKFTPTEGDSAGKEIAYKRLSLVIQIGEKEFTSVLKPSEKSVYDLIDLADDVQIADV